MPPIVLVRASDNLQNPQYRFHTFSAVVHGAFSHRALARFHLHQPSR